MKTGQRWYRRHQLFNQSVPVALLPWLFDNTSLTARLTEYCDENFTVRVLSQKWQKLDAAEAAVMKTGWERSALVRQVLLCCGDRPLVYARTVLPATTVQGAQRRYANMGNRPLGAMLFADRTMRREPVEIGMLAAGDIAQQYAAGAEPVWGRRSVFRVAGKPLLVAEYFLSELAEPRCCR